MALDRPGAPLAPALPETFQNTTAGFAVPLSGRLAGRASLGALLEVPNGLLVRARSLDTRRPHWYMYDSYPDIFIAQMALAVRFFDGFDLALGVHNNSGFQGAITAQIDLTTNTWSEREIDFKFTGQYGPMVGLRLARRAASFWAGLSLAAGDEVCHPSGAHDRRVGCGDAPRSVGVDARVTDRCWCWPGVALESLERQPGGSVEAVVGCRRPVGGSGDRYPGPGTLSPWG